MGRMTKKPKKIRLDELLVEQGVFPDAGTVLRAYVRSEEHFFEVERTLTEAFPGAVFAVLQGDVCRQELLVEVEGVHHI